ncbi:hypothetical protein AC1031_006198 [Aphanomyces cochlioides]|nr:hypothetical protein AC1031_006198 [Aphanomyces cochlioides]
MAATTNSSTEDVVVVHQRRDYITVVKADSPLHQTLRRLAAISNKDAPPKQEARASLPAEYSVNLLQPFGGASAGVAAEAHANQKAEASSLDKAHSGASAEKKADRGDIFYEKLIIFKTSHDRVKEQAATDNKRLSKQDQSIESERGQQAKQGQSINN